MNSASSEELIKEIYRKIEKMDGEVNEIKLAIISKEDVKEEKMKLIKKGTQRNKRRKIC